MSNEICLNKDTKIIFLDIDGVLNNYASLSVPTNEFFNYTSCDDFSCWYPPCVQQLKRIIKETGAKLVLSSSWRHDAQDKVIEGLLAFNLEPFIDTTAINDCHIRRGFEIQDWLDKHPEITNYVIIDDMNEMLESQNSRFVHTSMDRGLTPELAEQAIAILNTT